MAIHSPMEPKCENCRFFYRDPEVQALALRAGGNGIHGCCRRYAPARGIPQKAAPIVRYPDQRFDDDDPGMQARVREAARQFVQAMQDGVAVALPRAQHPSEEWQISYASATSVAPDYWCGEWSAAGDPLPLPLVMADWLEEHDELRAAEKLRQEFGP